MRCFTLTAVIFLSTPSARRATRAGLPESAGRKDFYPRPPRGGRLVRFNKRLRKKQISIHALREEGDPRPVGLRSWRMSYFYPRPPRGGRRPLASPIRSPVYSFLSTPSARRATDAGGDTCKDLQDFYPRPPRGGRPEVPGMYAAKSKFLSTPSVRRATR